MKCPICGYDKFALHCVSCNHIWEEEIFDPTELKDLIEKAMDKQTEITSWAVSDLETQAMVDTAFGRLNALATVKSYLSGDSEPLKKLAGME